MYVNNQNGSFNVNYDKAAAQERRKRNQANIARLDGKLNTEEKIPTKNMRVKVHHKAKNPPGRKAFKIFLFALVTLSLLYLGAYCNARNEIMVERGAFKTFTYSNGSDIVITDNSQIPKIPEIIDRMSNDIYKLFNDDINNNTRGN